MKVRCVRILQGGHHGGRDITDEPFSKTVVVGGEYVVLGILCQAEAGAMYSILRHDVYPGLAPASLTSEMFEIISPKIPTSWVAVDYYGDGRVIALEPEAWTDPPDFFERKLAGEAGLIDVFVAEVERLYAEEGEPPPARTGG